jgi:ribA/ribD-fused uncharacterized protein
MGNEKTWSIEMDLYFDDSSFLSNSSNHTFLLDGYLWNSVEHYFQANKYINNYSYFKEALNAETPKAAFHIGRKYPIPENWKEIREHIMFKALLAKFKYNEDIRVKLLNTENKKLIKDNQNDNYWGAGSSNSGQNRLGELLMLVRSIFHSICILESEISYSNISEDDIYQRYVLANFFRTLPDSFFSNLRHFQPQIGCFNNCLFCSQQSKNTVFSFSLSQLKNIIAALKIVAVEVNQKLNRLEKGSLFSINGAFGGAFTMPSDGLVGFGRISHRPGIIYCYYDNDIAVYPFLEQYLHFCHEDLGVKTRISTIGYSRHNVELENMHKKINDTLPYAIGGLRLSFTPYTPGYAVKRESLSRDEFEKDCANFLKTYKNVISFLGFGYREFCVELRHKPLLKIADVQEQYIDGHHIIICASYILVSKEREPVLTIANIKKLQGHSIQLDKLAQKYIMVITKELKSFNLDILIKSIINNKIVIKKYIKRECNLYVLKNNDGKYYAVDPSFSPNGCFSAKQFYPKTTNRNNSGYIDSERYFLNTLLEYKLSLHLDKNTPFISAQWTDVENVINNLNEKAKQLQEIDPDASEYILYETIPLITSYVKALKQADIAPLVFFDKNFTIDTGAICNMGNGLKEYNALTKNANMPVTPQHELIYGANGRMSFEGDIWRLFLDKIEGKFYIIAENQNLEFSSIDRDGNFNKIGNAYRYVLPDDPIVDTESGQYKIPGTKKKV